jgi:hypothetical protein
MEGTTMKFTTEMIKSEDSSPFEFRYGDDMTQSYLTVADWKMVCSELNSCHKLIAIMVRDLDALEQEIAMLKKAQP